MARPKSLIPSYRKHSSGNARVTINGRDYLLGPHGTAASKREYDLIVAEYLASGRSDSFGLDSDRYTIAMLMSDYLRHAKNYYGTDVASDYHRIKLAIRQLKELYAELPAMNFGPEQFKVVRQAMIREGLTRQGVNKRMKLIIRMVKWGCGEGKVPASVHATLRLIESLKKGRTAAQESRPGLTSSAGCD